MYLSGTAASKKMAAPVVGDLSNDGPSSTQKGSYEYANYDGLAPNHAHTLVKAFENLIVPIVRSYIPASGSTFNDVNRSTNLEREAEQLLGALKTFATALVRSQLGVADETQSNESGESANREESMIASYVQPSQDRTIAVYNRHTMNDEEQSLLKLVLEEAHHHVFNTMPIRLLVFKPNGSGIELMDRGAIWNRISTTMQTSLKENNIKYVIQQWVAATSTDSMTDEQKRKAGINALVEAYTKYAILSHTWLRNTPGEVTFADWQSGKVDTDSQGYRKLANFCRVAATDYGVQFGWMDSICINKESSSELDESIRSMFDWYLNSHRCITYLADTTALQHMRNDSWFTRGWTLQELLAPPHIKFYDNAWRGIIRGLEDDKGNPLIVAEIQAATKIVGEDLKAGGLWKVPISRRMRWAAHRQVTRAEDTAYSLMGIFGVSISTAYGEGSERAFVRLVKEILMTRTESVLDILNCGWGDEYPAVMAFQHTSILIPSSPKQYLWRADKDIHWYSPTTPVTLTHLGLHVRVLLLLGASVDPLTPDEFRPIGNYYASAKNVAIRFPSEYIPYNFHFLELNPMRWSITHSQLFMFFGILNLLEMTNTVELPPQGGCFAVPLGINPPPTAASIPSEEFTAWPIPTECATVFELKRFRTDSFIIPKNELIRHGLTLRTLYL